VLAWVVITALGADDVVEDVVVVGVRLSEARAEVDRALRDRGYLRLVRLGGRAYWLDPNQPWKPWVMVHREGFARVHGVRALPVVLPVLEPYQPGDLPTGTQPPWPEDWVEPPEEMHLRELGIDPLVGEAESTEPASGPAPVASATFLVPSPRAVRRQREDLAEALEPRLAQVREGLWQLARAERALELQDDLVAIWLDGVAPDGTPLGGAMARRAALSDRWLATEPDAAGAWARAIVEAFVAAEVQTSDHPFRAEEIERVNRSERAAALGTRFDPGAPRTAHR
jgi:hypothetical protein